MPDRPGSTRSNMPSWPPRACMVLGFAVRHTSRNAACCRLPALLVHVSRWRPLPSPAMVLAICFYAAYARAALLAVWARHPRSCSPSPRASCPSRSPAPTHGPRQGLHPELEEAARIAGGSRARSISGTWCCPFCRSRSSATGCWCSSSARGSCQHGAVPLGPTNAGDLRAHARAERAGPLRRRSPPSPSCCWPSPSVVTLRRHPPARARLHGAPRLMDRARRSTPFSKTYGAGHRRRPPQTSSLRPGEFVSLLGAVGLRQDHHPAHDRRLRSSRRPARIEVDGRVLSSTGRLASHRSAAACP